MPFYLSHTKISRLVADETDLCSFEQAENILSTRISRLRSVRQQERLEAVGDAFESPVYSSVRDQVRACLIDLSKVSRLAGRLQVALNAVTAANTLVEDTQTVEVDRELAHVLWQQGEHSTAITLLNRVHQRSGKKDAMIWSTLVSSPLSSSPCWWQLC